MGASILFLMMDLCFLLVCSIPLANATVIDANKSIAELPIIGPWNS
jgi:hypothetical protein